MEQTTPQTRSPLLRIVEEEGNRRVEMMCPGCETWGDILAYKNLQMHRVYAEHLNPVLKCGNCKHVFSPRWLNEEGPE